MIQSYQLVQAFLTSCSCARSAALLEVLYTGWGGAAAGNDTNGDGDWRGIDDELMTTIYSMNAAKNAAQLGKKGESTNLSRIDLHSQQ